MKMLSQLKIKEKLFAECFLFEQNFKVPSEMKNDACLIYIQEGTQEIFSPINKIVIQERESVLLKCGNYITNFTGLSTQNPLKSIVFHLDPEMIREAFSGKNINFLHPEGDGPENPTLKVNQNDLLDSFIQSLYPYFNNPHMVTENLLTLKLQELVLIISDNGRNPLANQLLSRLYTPDKIQFEKVIKAHLYTNFTISELAFLTHRSESTFKRDFKKWYGVAPAAYFKEKRMNKSADLLQHTNKLVSEIAWECGFENAAHFSAAFSKKYGKSPREFRK